MVNSSPGLSLTELASEENGTMCVMVLRIPNDCIVLLLFVRAFLSVKRGDHSVPHLFLTWHFYPLLLTVCSAHVEPVKLFLFFLFYYK